MKSVTIAATDGQTIKWTREGDDFREVVVSPSGALLVYVDDGTNIRPYRLVAGYTMGLWTMFEVDY